MRACLGDGSKLPPYAVFKRKTLPKNINFPKEVVVRCQAKGLDRRNSRAGLVTECTGQSWWPPQAKVDARLRFVPSAPVQTSSLVIPGVMTTMLQPLDVFINKPFKDRMTK